MLISILSYRSGSKYWTPLNIGRAPTDLKIIPAGANKSDYEMQYLEPVRYCFHAGAHGTR